MDHSATQSDPPVRARDLLDELEHCMREHRYRLRRSIQQAVRQGREPDHLVARVAKSRQLVEWRKRNLPKVDYPQELPITEHVGVLRDMIRKHPVLVVCGETGSGKSTQIPKMCLEAGFGVHGLIGQTQPRRIAARTVAERVSAEMSSPLGESVGYRVRFSEQVSDRNYIRILTDGMLLSEYENDPRLERYDVLIIDEAHERSLNIDFLLGLSRRILRKRPDFRLIITSATLDSEKFQSHFSGAPVVSVSGRLYPVEMRYRPLEDDTGSLEALPRGIQASVEELHWEAPGDVLVFLPGEREIRDAADWLRKKTKPGMEILPLYARLNPAEQQRIFSPGQSTRIILATNVAETSLTVPGIRYVIDSGLARISRYSPTRKLQRLPVEKVSRASADQRAGRCGRVASGICIRLFSEDDYNNRPAHTDPEIVRTSLADVILRMKTQGIGDIESFPFIERPSRRQIQDGIQHLVELGALDTRKSVTGLGRRISRLPVDPRIARMLLAAEKEGCLEEMLIITAALSLPDPRQSPADQLQKAKERHRSLSREESDFLVLLDIWRRFREIQKVESKRKAYRWCQDNFLSVFRMREWGALQASLKQSLRQMGIRPVGRAKDPLQIHRALLTGLLGNVAQRSEPEPPPSQGRKSGRKIRGVGYDGTFGKSLRIFPGSALSSASPKWIMCAELVETGMVYARTVAKVEASWIESAGSHLLQLHYSDPKWDSGQERVVARKRATLYGLTVYSGRKCDYSRVDPEDCRAIFIRSALVDGGLVSVLPFHEHNRALIREIESLEHRTRRRDILVDDAEIYSFYDDLIPDHVNSASTLRKWHRSLDPRERESLKIPRERLLLNDPDETFRHYPDHVESNGIALPLSYLYDPSSERDGVTARIRLPLLNRINGAELERLIPGLLSEKLIALIRTLPKPLRRRLVPIPDTVAGILDAVKRDPRPLGTAMVDAVSEYRGVEITPEQFDTEKLPAYLKIGLELIDERGQSLGFSRNLAQLKAKFGVRAHLSFASSGHVDVRREGILRWDFDSLPHTVLVQVGDFKTTAWPALVDRGDSVSIEIFDQEDTARTCHREGVRRLLWLSMPMLRKLHKQPLPDWQRISLMYASLGNVADLRTAILHKAQDQVYFDGQPEIRSRQDFETRNAHLGKVLPASLGSIAGHVADALTHWRRLGEFVRTHEAELPEQTLTEVNEQLNGLIHDGFVKDTPVGWLPELARFLEGIRIRLEQARLDPPTDQLRASRINPWWDRIRTAELHQGSALERYRWMLEEFRVSVFAQGLGTSLRISSRRMEMAWQEVEAEKKAGFRKG